MDHTQSDINQAEIAAHTPGPWFVESVDGSVQIWSKFKSVVTGDGGDDRHIASLTWGPVAERETNARLIAAAPDLLAALREFAEIHDNSPDDTPWGCGLTNGHFFRAKVAIAKATGEA